MIASFCFRDDKAKSDINLNASSPLFNLFVLRYTYFSSSLYGTKGLVVLYSDKYIIFSIIDRAMHTISGLFCSYSR